jgi:predicted membrane metal-binding protein
MVLTKTTLNVALTCKRPWLGCKMEKHRDSHTCLSSHSLFCLQACGLYCICGLRMAHTHYLFLLFLSLFFDWKYLFSLARDPLQNLLELGIDTLSRCGVKCTMLHNTRKATLKGQGHQRKRGCQRRRICKGEENLRVPV